MPDVSTEQFSNQEGSLSAAADSSGTLTRQDLQEVVDSAVSSIAGVDGKSISDVYTSLSSQETANGETVSYAAQLDYINSSILINMVLTGAILGAIVMRYLLDHFGRRVH